MAEDDETKVRLRAHKLWEAEGQPEGRADLHWTEAREIVALEEGAARSALKPVEENTGEPVEPTLAAENQGDVPVLTDLGDEGGVPSRAKAGEIANAMPPGESGAGAPKRGKSPQKKAK